MNLTNTDMAMIREWAASRSMTHTFYVDDTLATVDGPTNVIELVSLIERRASFDLAAQAEFNEACDYVEFNNDNPEEATIMLADSQREFVGRLSIKAV